MPLMAWTASRSTRSTGWPACTKLRTAAGGIGVMRLRANFSPLRGRIRNCGSLGIPSCPEQVIERRVGPRELGILRPAAGIPHRALDQVLIDYRSYIEK